MSLLELLRGLWSSLAIVAIALIVFLLLWLATRLILLLLETLSVRYVPIELGGLWAGLPLSIAGIIAGYLTGISREPAVNALVPAALTLIGGITIYLIGKERDKALIVGFGVAVFSFNLLIGATIGSVVRENVAERRQSLDYLKSQADIEFLIRQYRKGYGLPLSPSNTSEN